MGRQIALPPDPRSNAEGTFDRDIRDKFSGDIRFGKTGFLDNVRDETITGETDRTSHQYKLGNFSENMAGQYIAIQYANTFTGSIGVTVPHTLKRVPVGFHTIEALKFSATPDVANASQAFVTPQRYGGTLKGLWDDHFFRFGMIDDTLDGLDSTELYRLTLFLF